MLKHCKFAILLATLDIVFVNSMLRNPPQKPLINIQFGPKTSRSQLSTSNDGSPQQIINQINVILLCCDDDSGTSNCEVLDYDKACNRILITKDVNIENISQFDPSQARNRVIEISDSKDKSPLFGTKNLNESNINSPQKSSRNSKYFSFSSPNDKSQSRVTVTPYQPVYRPYFQLTRQQKSPSYGNRFGFGFESTPGVRFDLAKQEPRLTIRVKELDEHGHQKKFKKQGPYEKVNYEEFHRDMLDRHTYYRDKHGVMPLIHDPSLDESAQAYAKILAQRDTAKLSLSEEKFKGENLFYVSRRTNRMGLMAVDQWWSRLRYCTTDETALSLGSKMQQPYSIGNLLQLLWIGSTNVGFGIERGGSGAYFIVAHYTSEGNVSMIDERGINKGVITTMLPLPFEQEHIDEAKALSESHIKTVKNGYVYSFDNPTSEELALDFNSIDT